jgi:ferric-dicitrate binding protein FerR (iron transport regulator)
LEAKKKSKASKIIPLVIYAMIAASLVLLFGLYHVFVFSNTLQTDYGKTVAMTMKEGSQVTLNAKSKVSFPTLFKYNRTLKLEGEAFFEVTKGCPFTVETSLGKVQVLGTKFNVIARDDFFEVICYEGKVKVCSPSQSKIITPGQAVRFYQKQCDTWDEKETSKPLWLSGESSFKSVPLQYVVEQFQNQYHMEVTYPKELKSIKFSGTFTHKNKDTALESICIPLHLHYSQTSTSKILISE